MNPPQEKILIVEDEKDLGSLYTEVLNDEGYQVTWVCDGESALQEARKSRFDLILLDIKLPKTDGLQVLKSLDKSKNGKIIMLSSFDKESLIKDSLKNGAAGYIIKSSMNPAQILHEIRVYLSHNKD